MRHFRCFTVLAIVVFALWVFSGCGEEENKDLLKSRSFIHNGDYQSAAQSLEAALQAEPDNPEAICLREIISVRNKKDAQAWRNAIEKCLKTLEPLDSEVEELMTKEEPDEDEIKRLEILVRSRNSALGFLTESFADLIESDSGWAASLLKDDPDLVVTAMLKTGNCYSAVSRRKADFVISRIGSAGVDTLVSAAKDVKSDLCPQAILYLGKLRANDVLPVLVEIAKRPDLPSKAAYQLVIALANLEGEQKVPALRAILNNQFAQPKISAISQLEKMGAEEAIPELINSLADVNGYVVNAAKSALISFGKTSVAPLMEVVRTRGANVRLPASSTVTEDREKSARNSVAGTAMSVLASIGDDSVIPEFARLLGDDDLGSAAISAMTALGTAATEEAIEALKSDDRTVRVAAATVLNSILDRASIGALIDALSDPDKEVVAIAAAALGSMKVREAIPKMTELLADPDERIRSNVLTALNTIAYSDADMIQAVLEIANDKNERENIRISALTILKTLKPSESVDSLIRIMMAEDETADVRKAAVAALGEIKPEKAMEPMLRIISALKEKSKDYQRHLKRKYKTIEALNKEWDTNYKTWVEIKPIPSPVRAEVAYAFGKIKGERVVDPLIKALKDDDRAVVRKNAAWALGEIGGAKVVDPLVDALTDDDQGVVRNEAAIALSKIKSAKTVGALLRTVKKDKYETARKNALVAIKEIKPKSAIGDLIDLLSDKGKSLEERESDVIIAQVKAALINIGSPSVKPLLELLKHEEDYVVARAIYCLGQIGDKTALDPLMELIAQDENPMIRGEAIKAISLLNTTAAVKSDQKGESGLLDALTDPDEWKSNKAKAAAALGTIRHESAVEALVQAVHSPETELRDAAITALAAIPDYRGLGIIKQVAKTGDINAITALIKFKDREDEDFLLEILRGDLTSQSLALHELAITGLGDQASRKAVPVLIGILENRKLPVTMRAKAAKALGAIGDPAAIEPLLSCLNDPAESDTVWLEVASALGKEFREPRAESAIAKRLDDTWESAGLRAVAAEALGGIGTDSAIELLRKTKSDGDEGVRGYSLLGLGLSGNPDVIPELIEAVNSAGTESERYRAATALGNFKTAEVESALIETLGSTQAESVRKNSARSLGNIGSDKAVQALAAELAKADNPLGLRQVIAEALGETGNQNAVSALEQALKSEDPVIHFNAAKSLFKITGEGNGYVFSKQEIN